MKKIIATIALILNLASVPLALAVDEVASGGTCTDTNVFKNYDTPADYLDAELSEAMTSTNNIGLTDAKEGIATAYRNTYSCEYDYTDSKGQPQKGSSSVTVLQATACTKNSGGCMDSEIVQIIRAQSGTGLFTQYISAIYRWGASIGGMVSVVVIVWSGIQISTSQGKDVEGAKNRIIQSLSGLALLFLSGLLLYTINPTFFTK